MTTHTVYKVEYNGTPYFHDDPYQPEADWRSVLVCFWGCKRDTWKTRSGAQNFIDKICKTHGYSSGKKATAFRIVEADEED